jgi:hypothetical protein
MSSGSLSHHHAFSDEAESVSAVRRTVVHHAPPVEVHRDFSGVSPRVEGRLPKAGILMQISWPEMSARRKGTPMLEGANHERAGSSDLQCSVLISAMSAVGPEVKLIKV